MPIRFSALAATILGFSMTALGNFAFAQSPDAARSGAKSWVLPNGVIARVLINDQPVATLRTAAGGIDPSARAVCVKARFAALLESGLTAAQITVVPVAGQSWDIRGRGTSLLMVTPREAEAQGQPARRLALAWSANIKRRLSEPQLALPARSLLLPYSAVRTISISGSARAADIALDPGDPHIIQSQLDPLRRRLILRGIGTGQTTVNLRAGHAVVPLKVSVQRYAASVQPQVIVRVTGNPLAPAALVQTAVYLGLKRALNAEPGAQMRLLRAPLPVGSLRPGASVSRRLPVRIAGTGLLPVETSLLVTVLNQPLAPARAQALFYSNNPERVRESRALFNGPLALFQPVRLDYHHQNGSGVPLIFHADLVNSADQRASVHVLAGTVQPELDTVQVGRHAGAAFLAALDGGIGLVMDVPPHSRVPVVIQRFAPGLTASGLLQMQQITGPDHMLTVTVNADDDRQALVSSPMHLANAVAETIAPRLRLVASPIAPLSSSAIPEPSAFLFGPPLVSLTGTYTVGGNWSYVRLGHKDALRNAAGTQTLWGNYGVSYFVTVKVSNPTLAARTVGLFFTPEAGLAAGIFQVSGEPLLQFDPMAPPDEKLLTRIRLAPGQARTVHIRTLSLNGSAYPASLVTHAL